MKYLAMLKKEENIHQEALPKLPEPPFDSFGSDPERHVSEKQAPPDPAPRTPENDWFDDRICDAIEDLNDAGARYTDASQEDRDRARMLELEYTVAANDGDSPRFWKALREWKAIWIKESH
jgi:hypothetical protein